MSVRSLMRNEGEMRDGSDFREMRDGSDLFPNREGKRKGQAYVPPLGRWCLAIPAISGLAAGLGRR